jgi:hypothetical protein
LTSGLGAWRRCVVFNPHHPEAQVLNAPTHKQMQFLRDLAQKTGTTFTTPKTKAQASQEIKRMLRIDASPTARADRRHETKSVLAAIRSEIGGATAVRDHETTGHGSTAAWA